MAGQERQNERFRLLFTEAEQNNEFLSFYILPTESIYIKGKFDHSYINK